MSLFCTITCNGPMCKREAATNAPRAPEGYLTLTERFKDYEVITHYCSRECLQGKIADELALIAVEAA
jgi:hypothetical protein